jgi:hypothetical protein
MQTLRMCKLAILAVALGPLAQQAVATTVSFQFDASLQTGTLAGTQFSGSGSFDNQGETGVGTELFTLKSLDFSLLGFPVTLADINQGGQAVLKNGTLSDFTAAFILAPPAPVGDLAFGFGGPGVIGYSTPPGLGSGVYSIVTSSASPEPSSFGLWCAALGAILLVKVNSLRYRRSS